LAKTIWLTGFSGSGKSTIAVALQQCLELAGQRTVVLDGDEVRKGLCKDLGFSPQDRQENIRRVAEMAAFLNRNRLTVITALISPANADRAQARDIIGDGSMVEVYVSTSLAVCEGRDPKGLYKKARAGEIPAFTGVSAPYEVPANPQLILDTAALTPLQCVDRIMAALQ
jgi:adenylylsulfate kinase